MPDESHSAIGVDKGTYTAGDTITVTVELKDAQDNPVGGQASVLNPTTVTVPNTMAFTGSWAETGPDTGVYVATYTAQTAGSGLQATLKLSGWSVSRGSGPYTVIAGAADAKFSTLTSMTDVLVADGQSATTLTLTLMDAYNNPVILSAGVTFAAVSNRVTFGAVSYDESAAGVYTVSITAGTADGEDTLSALVSGTAIKSTGLTLDTIVWSFTAAGQKFTDTSGFPSTGFDGASFVIALTGSQTAKNYSSLYTFTTDMDWADAAGTTVTMNTPDNLAQGQFEFTVTGTAGDHNSISHKVVINRWFFTTYPLTASLADHTATCQSLVGSSTAALTADTSIGVGVRGPGTLWGEWGGASKGADRATGDARHYVAMGEPQGTARWQVRLDNGSIHGGPYPASDALNSMCYAGH